MNDFNLVPPKVISVVSSTGRAIARQVSFGYTSAADELELLSHVVFRELKSGGVFLNEFVGDVAVFEDVCDQLVALILRDTGHMNLGRVVRACLAQESPQSGMRCRRLMSSQLSKRVSNSDRDNTSGCRPANSLLCIVGDQTSLTSRLLSAKNHSASLAPSVPVGSQSNISKRPGKPFLPGWIVLGPVNSGLWAFSGEVSCERAGADLAGAD